MKYLIANWKMNSVDIDVWEQEFINVVSSQNNFPKSDEVKLIVCLNLYDYTVFSEKIKNSKNEIFNKISLFTQDVSQYDDGAFTGQISSKFLKKVGVEGSIIGHSELRENGDTENIVFEKGLRLNEQGLSNIFCIGEGLEILENNKKKPFLLNQLQTFCKDNISPGFLAYEPIWAIGTGKTCEAKDANKICSLIRKLIGFNDVIIQYGGSVKPNNIDEIMSMSDIDGVLVGGASLDPNSFARIANYQ